MSEIQPEEAPGAATATEADIERLQAEIDALQEQKDAGQPGGSIDAQIAEKQAQIAAADGPPSASADTVPIGTATTSTDPSLIANLTVTPIVQEVAPDSVNVTVYVGDTIYTGTIPKQ